MAAQLDPLLSALNEDYINDLPTSQSIANAAIIAIFAYLVPLLTMEINYFRFAVYKSWRRGNLRIARRELKKQNRKEESGHGSSDDCIVDDRFVINNNEAGKNGVDKGADIIAAHIDDDEDDTSAVGYLLNDVSSALHDLPARMSGGASRSPSAATLSIQEHIVTTNNNVESLYEAYKIIRQSSMYAIFTSLLVYTLTAIGISLNTRGLDPKVIAIIIGASQFMTALMVFIVSAKIPQWIGVYHAGAIRLVKCSSIYSQQFESLHYLDHNNTSSSSSNNSSYLAKLSWNVKLGVWFHFAKFYIILMPFYCGVQKLTIPLSIICGAVFGFILMWAVFVVHEKYIHHRNIVSFTTILLLSIISALTFTRGMAWIQVVWKLGILENEDALMVISFFTWLGILAVVHALFIWHTLRTEENEKKKMGSNTNNTEVAVSEEVANAEAADGDVSNHTTGQSNPKKAMRRNSSYDSFLFDPRTHFVDGKKCQFAEHPDLDDDSFRTNEMTDGILSNPSPTNDDARKEEDEEQGGEHQVNADCHDDDDDAVHLGEGFCIETPVVADTDNSVEPKFDDDDIDNNESGPNSSDKEEGNDVIDDQATPQPDFAAPQVIVSDTPQKKEEKRRRPICCRPACCANFICFSPEYAQSSCLWKSIAWTKVIVMVLTYLLCLYFVTVSIGATIQQNSVREALPAVQEALYNHMNEGPVCAFDNRGADSNITTFPDKEAAHEAGFLIVHCGSCGACSSWENLIIEYTTRDSMAAAANECAKKALFGGGDDALTECLMEPPIGFGYECALCWMEDILCTKEHCSFIFLQSQMINNVGNFAVGDDEVTSATCEEAHCEVGQFVPCSGATRRRMNITSSISRPGDQQCAIVDVESWEDLFFGSGVAL